MILKENDEVKYDAWVDMVIIMQPKRFVGCLGWFKCENAKQSKDGVRASKDQKM